MTQRVLYLEHNMDGTVGGSHYCLLEICRNLDKSRYQPVVVFYQANPLLDEFRATGAEILIESPSTPLHLRVGTGLLRKIFSPVQSAGNAYRTLIADSSRWLKRLRRLRIDIVHLNNSATGDHDLVIAARRLGIPCVAHQRGFAEPMGRLQTFIARRLTRVIAISTAVENYLRDAHFQQDRVTLVHDGIDPARIELQSDRDATRTNLEISPDAPVIGVVGNLKVWKGQETLIRAMPEVLRRFPETRCLIVGATADSRYVEKLRALVEQHGMHRSVLFLGYQRHPATFMSAMDVVVHTSVEAEPFGIVLLEGMALAKPVIATAHGGPLDVVIDNVTGYLTPPGNAEVLAHSLCSLLADPSARERMGALGRERMHQLFTAKRNAARLEEIYGELMKMRRGTSARS